MRRTRRDRDARSPIASTIRRDSIQRNMLDARQRHARGADRVVRHAVVHVEDARPEIDTLVDRRRKDDVVNDALAFELRLRRQDRRGRAIEHAVGPLEIVDHDAGAVTKLRSSRRCCRADRRRERARTSLP